MPNKKQTDKHGVVKSITVFTDINLPLVFVLLDSEATDPTSISTDEDEDGIEDDSLEDEEEESLPSTSDSKSEALTSATSPDHDEEEFLHTNYNFMEKEKFGKCLEQLQSGITDDVTAGRLSISSKFLSRAQMSQPK